MLRIEGVHKIYKDGKTDLHVLKGIDLEVKSGEKISIVGPSGAGKSTLLHIAGGIDNPTRGRVYIDDEDFYAMKELKKSKLINKKIGFVFQFYHLLSEFTALENVMIPGMIKSDILRFSLKELRSIAVKTLKEFGLGDRLDHRPSQLSGGEQQRVAIARAIINNPDILLCDEPTGNLDSKIGDEILNMLFDLNKRYKTAIVLVTHDREIAKRSDRVLEIKDGLLV
ncbi:MAG: ABC transporter ATP-binding protein [Candidatus Omnitrophota bacterium]